MNKINLSKHTPCPLLLEGENPYLTYIPNLVVENPYLSYSPSKKRGLGGVWITFASIFLLSIFTLSIFTTSCSPKLTLPKQNLSSIQGEVENTEEDDIAPSQEKIIDCTKLSIDSLHKINPVMSSSEQIKNLFNYDESQADITLQTVISNMTRNVESLYFTDAHSGFSSFSHPPAPEYLMGQNLPFDKDENAGGTDIFSFAPNKNNQIRFRSFSKINSPFWDSHPTAVTQTNSKGVCVTLLIFSSDRNNPFNKAVNLAGDTIYGGSTDLFYSFGVYKADNDVSDNQIANFDWTEAKPLAGVNSIAKNEGSPFVFCQCCNPTLLFSSNRDSQNPNDYDIYAAKLNIDFDNLKLDVISSPELIDAKSPITDSTTLAINTIADDRFPFIPYPHQEKGGDNFIYFSSDRNRKPAQKPCDCETGIDRTENIGGYDIYKYTLPERFNCPKPLEPAKPVLFEPELFAEIILINASNPEQPVKNSLITITDSEGNIIATAEGKSSIRAKLEFDKSYKAKGGSTFNEMDCRSSEDIIFRGYTGVNKSVYETLPDSSTTIDTVKGLTMRAGEFIKMNKISQNTEKGTTQVKGIETESRNVITREMINARIVFDTVYYDKQITTVKYWNKLDIRPDLSSVPDESQVQSALSGEVESVLTMNQSFNVPKPQSNEKIILKDTIYLLADYVLKPPCYCEFGGVLSAYQQNVPYFQTGFWEVNSIDNYRRHLRMLESSKYGEAKWIELHKNNQYFGDGMYGRNARFNEYEHYARVVDTNLSKMAEMIAGNIIPAFKVIDSLTPGSKLIISLDAWSDRRPVTRGWYIGDEVNYVEGSLIEGSRDYDIDFKKVVIDDRSSLNLNNDTLSRLRAYYGYKELLKKLLDTAVVGRGFYDYYISGQTLLPDDEKLTQTNLNLPFSIKSVEELVYNSKIIILSKGNYFDSTEYKIPRYIKDIDSSLFMLDTIRRIDVRINTLLYEAGKLIKSPCCNENLPCVDYRKLLDLRYSKPETNAVDPRKRERKK